MLSFNKKNILILNLENEIGKSNRNFIKKDSFKDELNKILIYNEYKPLKGILLNINSPGGSAGLSEELANNILKIRSNGIPVVASVIDYACSGAYLVASSCNKIFANRMSIVGSIGVIMQIPNFKSLAEKFGVTSYTIKSGTMKDIGNPLRDMTEEEKQYLENIVKGSHDIFKKMVLKNRPKINDNFSLFEGQIFNAEDAKKYGLIDNIGNSYDALQYLLQLANVTVDDIKIINSKKGTFISNLLDSISFLPNLNISLKL